MDAVAVDFPDVKIFLDFLDFFGDDFVRNAP